MSASRDSDTTENCNFSEDGWCQCQSNTGCLTSLDCTGWRPWGNAATGICPGPCQCEEEQAWNSVVPPRPNYQWVKNFIELRRQWSDHARKNLIKFNQVPKSKNSTLPTRKPALPTTSSQTPNHLTEDKNTTKSPSNEITLPYSSDPFHTTERHYSLQDSQEPSLSYKRKKTLKNSTHNNSESPIPASCCQQQQSATNSPLYLPFPRSGNNFLYPHPEAGCLCQPMPRNGSSPIRIDVRAINECTCECPYSPECACPPSERRFLPVKKHCPNSRLCHSPMFRISPGSRCRCTKCQQFGPFPIPCNPCAATKCSVGQKGCGSFNDCKVDKDIPVKVIDIKIDQDDQDQSTLGNEEIIKRQVSSNDTVEIREDVIDLLYLFPVENQEDPPIDKEQVVIENKAKKVKSCPEGCGACCLVRYGLKVSKEMIKGIDKINKQDVNTIDQDNKEEIELREVSDGKDCRIRCGLNFCSKNVSLEADDDKIEIKGINVGTEVIQSTNWVDKEIQAIDGDDKEEINLSGGFSEFSDGKGCKKRCDAKFSSKDSKDVRLHDDKVKIQVMDVGKEVILESVYEGKAFGNNKKYPSDDESKDSKETLTVDELPILKKSIGKCKSNCSERCREKNGSKDDFLKKESKENEDIKVIKRGEKDGKSLESDEWTFVDVEYNKKPIKLFKAIDEKKNRKEKNSHQKLFDYVVVKFVKRVSTDSVVVVNKLFRPSYSSQEFGDDRGGNSDFEDMADSILSFQGIDDHQSISTMEILVRF